MGGLGIILDAYFVATADGDHLWLERIDFLVEELSGEYPNAFAWAQSMDTDVDVLFVLYAPPSHSSILSDKVIETHLAHISRRAELIYVAACGRNYRENTVTSADVAEIVNSQCLLKGQKGEPIRALRPTDLDEAVRQGLISVYTRRQRQFGTHAPMTQSNLTQTLDIAVTSELIYRSSDL